MRIETIFHNDKCDEHLHTLNWRSLVVGTRYIYADEIIPPVAFRVSGRLAEIMHLLRHYRKRPGRGPILVPWFLFLRCQGRGHIL